LGGQFQGEQLAAQESSKEAFHRFHVICR
jgi:hypothetical protein